MHVAFSMLYIHSTLSISHKVRSWNLWIGCHNLSVLLLLGKKNSSLSLLCRRKKQKADSGGDEKKAVASYFNTQGFERWRKIYGDTDDVNKVQQSDPFSKEGFKNTL